MKKFSKLTFWALLVLLYFCNGEYFVGNRTLYTSAYNILYYYGKYGEYYCEKYQSTVLDDSINPTLFAVGQSLTAYSQTSCVKFFKLQLSNTDSTKYINVDAKITSKPSNQTVKPLFSYKIGEPPLLIFEDHDYQYKWSNIMYESVQFDFNGKESNSFQTLIIVITSNKSVLHKV